MHITGENSGVDVTLVRVEGLGVLRRWEGGFGKSEMLVKGCSSRMRVGEQDQIIVTHR